MIPSAWRSSATVDIHLVLARRGQDPAYDQVFSGNRFDSLVREEGHDLLRAPAVQFEGGLHDRFLASGADEVGARALAQREVQGVDYDGLARTGLAGEHVQPRGKLYAELIDDGEIFYIQFF